MPIEVKDFQVTASKHPQESSPSDLVWKVFVKVRFASDDPAEWGELRAFGGHGTGRSTGARGPKESVTRIRCNSWSPTWETSISRTAICG